MKNQLNRDLIEELNESSNETFKANINNYVYSLMESVIQDISVKSPFVRLDKCVLMPVNEMYLGAFTQLSEYTYFLGLENKEIEFNSKNKKNWWKYVWREFRAAWRLGKKKYKKRRQEKQNDIVTVEKYQLSDFKHDVVYYASEYLRESSMIYEFHNHFSMIGYEDFGTNVKINIFVVSFDSKSGTFKLFNQRKNNFIPINFGNRFKSLDQKREICGEMFVNMIKIFNAVYSKTYNKIPDQILVESLIYNCPKVLFDKKDVYKSFVNVANYIRLANPKSFISICNESKNIFEEPLILKKGAQMDFGKIINMLDRFKY